MSKTTRREFLKLGLAAAGAAAAASAIEIPLLTGKTSSLQTQLNNSNAQATAFKTQLSTVTGFLTLSLNEQSLLEPVVETIIPSDSNGVGAKEAGVIYFIDHQLAGDYGRSGNMFMDPPHVLPGIPATTNVNNALTVPPSRAWAFLQNTGQTAYLASGGMGNANPISYLGNATAGPFSAGGTNYTVNYGITASPRVGSGINYQYPINMREFWRIGLVALQNYAKTAYGGNFQTLSSANQLKLLQDLWANKPTPTTDDLTGFNNLVPSDFAYELVFMAWSGFLMDPLYGGNQNMVGWSYVGYNGVNLGNFYGEGQSQKSLMVASSPTRLKPASLAQYQNAATGGA